MAASGSTPLSYRRDIDGLRALAVVAVVVFHAAPRLAPGGFVGVDVFFVISGYLISGIILDALDRGTFSYAAFYARRVRRIFPALAVVLAAVAVAGWIVLSPAAYGELGRNIAAGAAFLSNVALWRHTDYFAPASSENPLLHLWSLGVEEQFYLIWPALLVWLHRRRHTAASFPIVAIAAIGAGSFIANVALVHQHAAATFYLPTTRLWELALGALLAESARRRALAWRGASALSIAGLLAIGAAIALLDASTPFPGWWALLPTLGTCALIAAGEGAIVNRTLLSAKPVVFVGLISYSLYLWHWPTLAIGRIWSSDLAPTGFVTVALLAIALAGTIATYYLVERPIRFRFKTNRRLVPALVGAVAVLGAFGTASVATHGWPRRFPPNVGRLFAYDYDPHAPLRVGTCLLVADEPAFAPECIDSLARTRAAPIVFLWGDSHAAMYYRGLEGPARERGVALAQLTTSACPPILRFDMPGSPRCRERNAIAADSIAALRPATVILVHDWPRSVNEPVLPRLGETVRMLRAAGVKRVVIVGPVPRWTTGLPNTLVRTMLRGGLAEPPRRLRTGLDPSIPALDRTLDSLATALGAVYVSPLRALCDDDGCLTLVPGSATDLFVWDNAHLTVAGATYLVRRLETGFLGERP